MGYPGRYTEPNLQANVIDERVVVAEAQDTLPEVVHQSARVETHQESGLDTECEDCDAAPGGERISSPDVSALGRQGCWRRPVQLHVTMF